MAPGGRAVAPCGRTYPQQSDKRRIARTNRVAAPPIWEFVTWTLMILMWWIMMIAMMTPSAAPATLLYARVHRHALAQGQVQDTLAPTGAFAAGYMLVWLGFAVAATTVHWSLE